MIGLVTVNPSAGAYEPFSMIFSLQGDGIQWFIMPAVIVGCFFIPDMFCRFFCPAGEMLTLLVNLRNTLVYQIKQVAKRKET
jgi:polyferredoxin